jgi:aspartyl-tRNA synthetase
LEVSFGSARDIQNLVEGLVRSVWKKLKDVELFEGKEFPRMNYQVAMSKYGSDKPDTRFGLEIQHITDLVGDNVVEAIVMKNDTKLSGSELKRLAQLDNKVNNAYITCFFLLLLPFWTLYITLAALSRIPPRKH